MKPSSAAKWGCQVPVVAFLLLLIVSYVGMEILPSEGKKALPSSASNIEEYLSHGFIGTDHTRLLKADLPKESYPAYAHKLELSTRFDPQKHSEIQVTLNMGIGAAPDWWTPPLVDQNTYFKHTEGDDHLRVLRYFDGAVYYLEMSW